MSYTCNYLNKDFCDACGYCCQGHNGQIKCSCCDSPIKEEFYYIVNDNIYCKDCLDMNFRFEKELNEQ